MRYKPYLQTIFFAAVTLMLVIGMIRFPQTAFDASLRGLKIWWDIVFPSLLPFVILSELMMGFGVVHFMGVLLEPVMRPLFNVPGTGGFVMAMGMSSSYPVGPKLATRLREQRLVSRAEGERLLCFTSTSDPLFIFGAVAVGFFHHAEWGVVIAVSNYAGAILLGMLLRFHDWRGGVTFSTKDKDLPLLLRALRAMHRARLKDKRPLGKLMGEAVLNAFQTLLVIGGFIIIFSVVIKFISAGLIGQILAAPVSLLLMASNIPRQMSQAFVVGFFEVTQSMQHISELGSQVDLRMKLAVASALIAWGGISVHAQVASIISTTDLRYLPYFIYKFVHALITGILAYALWEPLSRFVQTDRVLPAFARTVPDGVMDLPWDLFQYMGLFALSILLLLLLVSFILSMFKAGRS